MPDRDPKNPQRPPRSASTHPAALLPEDPKVDAELAKKHKLSPAEFERIVSELGRLPTYAELGVFSVMWSEHCSYKSSRVHLRKLPTKGPRVIQGPGENAGVVDIGDGYAAVFKMESHNHPSFIEPHQGAATGVGGILRDVFTMGARPIASLDSLRFGRPDHPRTPELLRGVVAGIAGYGNCIGVPTVGGELQFDARYDGNILVNAFTCGIARTDRIFYGRATGIDNAILYMGAKTGRDGIHGATMASDEFSGGGPSQRPTMQVGDPFLGKLLLEACLELFHADVLEGIQDMGAAGLTSSSVEMAGRGGNGIELSLDDVPRRARGMTPYEILLSESQERMLLVAKPGKEDEVLAICRRWDLDCAVIGRVTATKRWVITATPGYDPIAPDPSTTCPVVVCDLPIAALTDDAPVYERPESADGHSPGPTGELPRVAHEALAGEIKALLGTVNVGSKSWVYRQYDHIVRGGTVVGPGGGAAVVRVQCERDTLGTLAGAAEAPKTEKILAFASDCNGRLVELDPFAGAAMAVAETCRNLVCAGAEPLGLTDCLNFGNPERPHVMRQFARAIDGIAAACRALEAPIVSGNVSLYNETDGRAILPTPTIAGVGLVGSIDEVVTPWWKAPGDVVFLLGPAANLGVGAGLAGSEYAAMKMAPSPSGAPAWPRGCPPPSIDLDAEAKLQRLLLTLVRERKLRSAHDVADGGLAVTLSECATAPEPLASLGARIDLELTEDPALQGLEIASLLFGEHPSRVVVSVLPADAATLAAKAAAAGVALRELGVTGADTLSIHIARAHGTGSAPVISAVIPLSDLRHARAGRALEALADR
jgi:phosphoribosylformylglycinamidine synthase